MKPDLSTKAQAISNYEKQADPVPTERLDAYNALDAMVEQWVKEYRRRYDALDAMVEQWVKKHRPQP